MSAVPTLDPRITKFECDCFHNNPCADTFCYEKSILDYMAYLETTDLQYFLDHQQELVDIVSECIFETYTPPKGMLARRLIQFIIERYDQLIDEENYTSYSVMLERDEKIIAGNPPQISLRAPNVSLSPHTHGDKTFPILLEQLFCKPIGHMPGGSYSGSYGCEESTRILNEVLNDLDDSAVATTIKETMTKHMHNAVEYYSKIWDPIYVNFILTKHFGRLCPKINYSMEDSSKFSMRFFRKYRKVFS